jgi:hypothetical protein
MKFLIILFFVLSLVACQTKTNHLEFRLISFYQIGDNSYVNKVEIINKSDNTIFFPVSINDSSKFLAFTISTFLCEFNKGAGIRDDFSAELNTLEPKANDIFLLSSQVDLTSCKNHAFSLDGFVSDDSGIKVPQSFIIRFLNGKCFWEFDETFRNPSIDLPYPKD